MTSAVAASTNFASNSSGSIADSNDFVVYCSSSGLVSYDPDGNGPYESDAFASFAAYSASSGADIMLIRARNRDHPMSLDTNQIKFVDTSVGNPQAFGRAFTPGSELVGLNSSTDGLAQIIVALAAQKQWRTIHIFSRGAARARRCSDLTLDACNFQDQTAALQAIGANRVPGGDILLYRCDVAQGSAGAEFTAALALATGADVAVSIDLTGAASHDDDWLLETSAGPVISAALASGFAE